MTSQGDYVDTTVRPAQVAMAGNWHIQVTRYVDHRVIETRDIHKHDLS